MKRFLLASLLAVASASAFAAPVPYTLDPNHTQIQFSYNHFGFSNITGRFDKFEGDFQFDAAHPEKSSVSVTIPIDSVDMGVEKLDAHLKTPDFFDAAKFPTMSFHSTKVSKVDGHHLRVAGDLSIHGVTKPVVLNVTINKIGEHPMAKVAAAGFDASTKIKRSDFGVGNYAPAVSDEVTIHITTETRVAEASK